MPHHDPFVTRFDPGLTLSTSGPLSGLTFGVKDLVAVAGHANGNGNPTRERVARTATDHAATVAVCLKHGATLAGVTRMDELALSLNGINGHVGAELNPRYPGAITGGSSSGSASAVAGEDVTFALGSDTGGSLRLPASFCGLYTLRPTYGRIDTTGMLPLAPSFDTPGVFTRDLALLTQLMGLLLKSGVTVFTPRQVRVPQNFLDLADQPIKDAVMAYALRVAKTYGMTVDDTPLSIDPVAVKRAFLTLLGAEAYATYADLLVRAPETLLDDTRAILEAGARLEPARRDAQLDVRMSVTETVHDLLADTLLVLPAAPSLPPATNAPQAVLHLMNQNAVMLNGLGSLTGVPCLVVPTPVGDSDTTGVMLIGPSHSDEHLLSLAAKVG